MDTPHPCLCGSGLSAHCCCKLELGDLPADDNRKTSLAPLTEQAATAVRRGDSATAARLCLAVLERVPTDPAALRVLADIRFADGNPRAAAALLRRLLALDPNDFWATNKLGLVELMRGNAAGAEPSARNAVRLAPEDPQAHNLMAMTMTELRQATVGEHHCRRALALSGERHSTVLANLATNLVNQSRIAEARALYRESDERAPNVRQTLLAWARMEEADRKLDAAEALLDRLDALVPDDPAAALVRATILGRRKRYDEAIAVLDGKGGAQRTLNSEEMLEKGRLLDKLGRYDEAWSAFMAGKAAAFEASGRTYESEEARAQVARLKGFFQRHRLAQLPRAGVRTDIAQPIFILGFPRSGTTLLEQTLAASPAIAGGDELPLISELARLTPRLLASPLDYPEALAELWMGDMLEGLDDLRDRYLQRARQLGVMSGGVSYFTDKMPLNETHLGLIALLFPRAPLLHVVRHPLDVMVSAMSNFFTHGRFCGTALESAAEHLVLTHDLVAHYRSQMDLRYRCVRYENIVDDQDATIRSVFAFIDVPFDDAALRFETHTRYARTASYAQVAEKLHPRSRFRYRNYLKHLAPAIPILTPLMDQLDYTV